MKETWRLAYFSYKCAFEFLYKLCLCDISCILALPTPLEYWSILLRHPKYLHPNNNDDNPYKFYISRTSGTSNHK